MVLRDCAVLPAGVSPFRLLVTGEGEGGSSDVYQMFLQWLSTREDQPIPNSLQERSAVWYSGAYGRSGIKGLHMRRSRSLSLLNLILLPVKPVFPYREDFCPMSSKFCLTDRQSSEPSLHTTTNWWTRTQVCCMSFLLAAGAFLSEIQWNWQTLENVRPRRCAHTSVMAPLFPLRNTTPRLTWTMVTQLAFFSSFSRDEKVFGVYCRVCDCVCVWQTVQWCGG